MWENVKWMQHYMIFPQNSEAQWEASTNTLNGIIILEKPFHYTGVYKN